MLPRRPKSPQPNCRARCRRRTSPTPYPPLWDGLGTLTHKITTDDPQAQAYFDQGLRLAYGYNHDEARRAFREAQHRDPDCAMCYWGEALVLGPNINLPMPEEAVAPAYRGRTEGADAGLEQREDIR